MPLRRRQLLRFALGGGGLAVARPLVSAPAALTTLTTLRGQQWRYHIIGDRRYAPVLQPGQAVLVDVSAKTFTGNGLYLYPDWGQPAIYNVIAGNDTGLEFRDPLSGALRWTERLPDGQGGSRFAGRLAGLAPDTGTMAALAIAPLPRPA